MSEAAERRSIVPRVEPLAVEPTSWPWWCGRRCRRAGRSASAAVLAKLVDGVVAVVQAFVAAGAWPARPATAWLEALRAGELLRAALVDLGQPGLVDRLVVRPLLAIVGGRLLVTSWPAGVTVVMTRQLVPVLRAMPAVLNSAEVEVVFERARRSTTWAAPAR